MVSWRNSFYQGGLEYPLSSKILEFYHLEFLWKTVIWNVERSTSFYCVQRLLQYFQLFLKL